jgi:3',5'-cyclic AMP phosphodiesterase CpdA
MTTTLHFAQLSDIHISSLGDHHDLLSGRSAGFLEKVIARLNQIDDLDFVFISGDLFDMADDWEFGQFHKVISALQKPTYILPGNHDRRAADRSEGLTRRDFAYHFNPQFEERPTTPIAQAGYWSIAINPQVQLIGLDSIRDADWGGIIDRAQIEWLKKELDICAGKLVIVGVHHPLHKLAPIDDNPRWRNFVCDNGSEVLTLLDGYRQVKMVLHGHHHITRVDRLGQRLHFACPAIAVYPCAYRTFRLTSQSDAWQVNWQTHPATAEVTIAEAHKLMIDAWQEVGFEADFVAEHVVLAYGSEYDRNGGAILL